MRTLILPLVLLTTVAACGGDTSGTRVALRTRLVTDLNAERTFTTGLGWTIKLEKAAVSTGALYYFDGEPAFTRVSPVRRFLDLLVPIAPAYAHPGHYAAGTARGQQLAPSSADLMAGPATLPDGEGTSGPFNSGTFTLAAPSAGPAVSMLEGHVAMAEGVATKGARTVHFRAFADLADVEKTAKDGQVTGCVFQAADVTTDGTVTITVRPHVWFGLVDFTELADGTGESPTILAADSTPRIAFALGLGQLSAYEFSYATP